MSSDLTKVDKVTLFNNGSATLQLPLDPLDGPIGPTGSGLFWLDIKKEYIGDAVSSFIMTPPGSAVIKSAKLLLPKMNPRGKGVQYRNTVEALRPLIGTRIKRGGVVYILVAVTDPQREVPIKLALYDEKEGRIIEVQMSGGEIDAAGLLSENGFVLADTDNEKQSLYLDNLDEKGTSKVQLEIDGFMKDEKKIMKPSLEFTIPAPAHKFIYSLHVLEGTLHLICKAFVINDSGLNWEEVDLAIATKETTTFDTDILEYNVPTRKKINLTNDTATAALEVETHDRSARMTARLKSAARPVLEGGGHFGANSRCAAPNMMMAMACNDEQDYSGAPEEDEMDGVEMSTENRPTEYTFRAKACSIGSGTGAAVHLYERKLNAEVALYAVVDRSSPITTFSVISFNNTNEFDLQKGVANVFIDNELAGKAMMPFTRRNDDCMLTHEVSGKMRIEWNSTSNRTSERSLVRGKGGIMPCRESLLSEIEEFQTYTYTMENMADKESVIIMDVSAANCTVDLLGVPPSITVDRSKIPGNIIRFRLTIPGDTLQTFELKYVTKYQEQIYIKHDRHEIISMVKKERNVEPLEQVWRYLQEKTAELDSIEVKIRGIDGDMEKLKAVVETHKNLTSATDLTDRASGSKQFGKDLQKELENVYLNWRDFRNKREVIAKEMLLLEKQFDQALLNLIEND